HGIGDGGEEHGGHVGAGGAAEAEGHDDAGPAHGAEMLEGPLALANREEHEHGREAEDGPPEYRRPGIRMDRPYEEAARTPPERSPSHQRHTQVTGRSLLHRESVRSVMRGTGRDMECGGDL